MRVWDQLEYFARLHGLSPHDARDATAYWTQRLGIAERAGIASRLWLSGAKLDPEGPPTC